MAILDFQKPDKVIMIEKDDFSGQFEFRPLEPGYGITVGNALRRILLSSLEGYAITTVKIEGVEHEFGTINNVKEEVSEIILNLKEVHFKLNQKEDVVLDVGCGTGKIACAVAPNVKEVHGLDISEEMIAFVDKEKFDGSAQ